MQTQLQSAPAVNTIVRENVNRTEQDPLTSLFGPFYIEQHTTRSLQREVAPLSYTRPTVSRFYPKEKVVVDFENKVHWDPAAKRRWCHGQGIAYIAISALEQVTLKDVEDRLRVERELMAADEQAAEPETNDTAPQETPTDEPTIADLMARPETAEGVAKLVARDMATLKLSGVAVTAKTTSLTKHYTETLIAELSEGRLGVSAAAVDEWLHVQGA